MRRTLVTALASCAEKTARFKTRRFLAGLSCDELQFLAEFLGASILEWGCGRPRSRAELAERVSAFQRARWSYQYSLETDQDHKIILLLEFLCLSDPRQSALAMGAGER